MNKLTSESVEIIIESIVDAVESTDDRDIQFGMVKTILEDQGLIEELPQQKVLDNFYVKVNEYNIKKVLSTMEQNGILWASGHKPTDLFESCRDKNAFVLVVINLKLTFNNVYSYVPIITKEISAEKYIACNGKECNHE